MTGLAYRVRHRLETRPGLRLGVALLVACAAHAAVIMGIEWPARDAGFGTRALDINLSMESAPASSTDPASHTPEAFVSRAEASGGPPPEAEPAPSPANEVQTAARQQPPSNLEPAPTIGEGGLSYSELAREIASAHAHRERADVIGAGGTKTKRLTPNSAKSAAEAAYLDMWRQKTERIGRANYPPGGLSGDLLLLAVIRQDGVLHEVRVLESSGYPALDEAALRTVRLAAPYPHFPTEMRKSYNRLEIVRRWRFERGGASLH